jgi:hypothetical protein
MVQMDGTATPPHKSESSLEPIANYFRDLKKVTFQPTLFFKALPVSGGIGGPLAFALVTHWIGAALGYFMDSLTGNIGERMMHQMVQFSSHYSTRSLGTGDIDAPMKMANGWMNSLNQGQKFADWIWGSGGTLLDPFFTLVIILFTSFFVFIGARLFVNPTSWPTSRSAPAASVRSGGGPMNLDSEVVRFPSGVTYESALRVVAFGMSPAIFAGVPYFGWIASWVFIPIVTIIGAREIYRISPGRATVVGLFPSLLFLGILSLGLVIMMMFFMKLIGSLFI